MKKSIEKICVTAIMIAISSVLSMIKIPMGPLGGSITLLSMVPVSLIGIWYGFGYAILPCVMYGGIQMFLDGFFGWGLTPAVLIGSMFLDYLLAFGCISFSGVLRKIKNGRVLGVVLACVLRFVCHFISGIILFRSFEVFNNPWIWSICYNGSFMLPELIITTIGILALDKTGIIDRMIKP